jgi:hypothetical protein
MAYGTIKVDNIVFDDGGSDQTVTVSGLYNSLTSGITVTGTISGAVVIGSTSVSGTTVAGVTVTGTTVQGASGTFTSLTGTTIQGTTATYTTGSFTSLTGTTTTGTTSSFTSGVFTTLSGATATFTSGIIASGTAAAPSLAILGDPNTGIFSPGADQVAVATNGTGRLFVNSTGQVGLGVTPSAALHILAPGTSFTGLQLQSNRTTGNIGGLQFLNSTSTLVGGMTSEIDGSLKFETGGANERLRITAAGNVGIGTTDPSSRLSVISGSGSAFIGDNLNLLDPGTANTGGIYLGTSNNTDPTAGIEASWGGVTTPQIHIGVTRAGTFAKTRYSAYHDGSLRMFSGTSERARIDPSGRLLVGTSSALTSSISQVPRLQVLTGDTNDSGMLLGAFSAGSGRTQLNFVRSKSSSIGANTVVVNGDVLGEISWNGADGTGYIKSAQIFAAVDGTPGVNNMPGRLVFSTTSAGASTSTERMRITNGGNLLFNHATVALPGNNNTNQGLTVEAVGSNGVSVFISRDGACLFLNRNSDGVIQDFRRSGTSVGSISVTTSATAYNTSSDYRLKENVVDLDGAIDRLKQLPVHRFNFIADPDTVVDGFLAHEAAEAVPECVTGTKDEVDDDGNPVYQGIDQSKLVPLLTAALQEAVARIESLEARLTAAGI